MSPPLCLALPPTRHAELCLRMRSLGITIFNMVPAMELVAGGYSDRYGTIDRHEDAVIAMEQHALWRMEFEAANPPNP